MFPGGRIHLPHYASVLDVRAQTLAVELQESPRVSSRHPRAISLPLFQSAIFLLFSPFFFFLGWGEQVGRGLAAG